MIYIKMTVSEIPNYVHSGVVLFVLLCYSFYGEKPTEGFSNQEEHALRINNDAQLVKAVMNDDIDYIEKHYHNNELLYGDDGNTIYHHIVYHKLPKTLRFFLKMIKEDNTILEKSNKDDNTVTHIVCLKGDYNTLHYILKILVDNELLENKNIHGDNILHCAVRSGSYNCVNIILNKLNNQIQKLMDEKNNWGEKPLHTAVNPVRDETEIDEDDTLNRDKDRMNFNIVKLLVEKGDIEKNINPLTNNDLLLGQLQRKPLSIVGEQIRTYLQKKYYDVYNDKTCADNNANPCYTEIIKNFPAIRPYELKSSNENFDVSKIKVVYPDETIDDKELYTPKTTEPIKMIP